MFTNRWVALVLVMTCTLAIALPTRAAAAPDRGSVSERLEEAIIRAGYHVRIIEGETAPGISATVDPCPMMIEWDGWRWHCRSRLITITVRPGLEESQRRFVISHELGHALVFARTGTWDGDDLGHPRSATEADALALTGPRELGWEPPARYCYATLTEWIACEVARTGEFR